MAKRKGLWANIHAKRKRGEKPAKPGDKGYPKTLDIMKEGGKAKKEYKPHMMYGDGKSKKANTYEEHSALKKKGWGHSKKAEKGGLLKGPSHDKGGIPIEVEGGEYIIKKESVNNNTESVLEYINENGKLPNEKKYNYPTTDARNRSKE